MAVTDREPMTRKDLTGDDGDLVGPLLEPMRLTFEMVDRVFNLASDEARRAQHAAAHHHTDTYTEANAKCGAYLHAIAVLLELSDHDVRDVWIATT